MLSTCVCNMCVIDLFNLARTAEPNGWSNRNKCENAVFMIHRVLASVTYEHKQKKTCKIQDHVKDLS